MIRRLFLALATALLVGTQFLPSSHAGAASISSLTLSPSSGKAGSNGQAYGATSERFKNTSGTLVWDGSLTLASFKVNSLGQFSASFMVPAASPSQHQVETVIGGVVLSTSTFTVTASTTTPSPSPTSTTIATATPTRTPSPTPTSTATPTATSTPSSGAMAPPPGYSAANLVFDDLFAGSALDTTKWNTFLTSKAANGYPWNSDGTGGSGMCGGNDGEYFKPSQVSVNGGLSLTALETSTNGDCNGIPTTFPWESGVVSTYGKFEFKGGYLQAKVKMPSGNGMWPGIWMLPGSSSSVTSDNFEIDVFEGDFTSNGVPADQNFAWHLHSGGESNGGTSNTGLDLSQDYHVYGIRWIPGISLTWYFDGTEIGQVTSATTGIPDELMEIIIDSGVATGQTSGWHSSFDASTPSVTQMLVSEVQVYE